MCVYSRPSPSDVTFVEQLAALYDDFSDTHQVIIVGDFNCHELELVFHWRRAPWSHICGAFRCVDWTLPTDVDSAASYLTNQILTITKRFVPYCKPRLVRPVPWWNGDCQRVWVVKLGFAVFGLFLLSNLVLFRVLVFLMLEYSLLMRLLLLLRIERNCVLSHLIFLVHLIASGGGVYWLIYGISAFVAVLMTYFLIIYHLVFCCCC